MKNSSMFQAFILSIIMSSFITFAIEDDQSQEPLARKRQEKATLFGEIQDALVADSIEAEEENRFLEMSYGYDISYRYGSGKGGKSGKSGKSGGYYDDYGYSGYYYGKAGKGGKSGGYSYEYSGLGSGKGGKSGKSGGYSGYYYGKAGKSGKSYGDYEYNFS